MITDTNKEKAKKILGEVLDAFHEKRYKDVPSIVDEVALEGFEDALECIEMMIDPDTIDKMDNEELMDFYEFEDGSGFSIDYQLACCGEIIDDIVLVLDFVYDDSEIKSILHTIDAM